MLPTKFLFISLLCFRGEDFLEINQSATRIACGGHVCERIGTKWAFFLYRGPSIYASYHVWVHLAQWFQRRRFFRNRPIRNKNCLWRPCLLTDRDEMANLYRGPSIHASYQVSVHLAKGFQRRRLKCEKLTDDRRWTTDAKWWQMLTLPLARWAKTNDIKKKFHENQKKKRYTNFFLKESEILSIWYVCISRIIKIETKLLRLQISRDLLVTQGLWYYMC